MNKHEKIRMMIEFENASQGVFTENQMNELRTYFLQCEATEKELEKCNISDTSKEESSMKQYCLYEDTIHKLEQLQQDIKKYFDFIGDEETDEYIELFQRLSKVGEKT